MVGQGTREERDQGRLIKKMHRPPPHTHKMGDGGACLGGRGRWISGLQSTLQLHREILSQKQKNEFGLLFYAIHKNQLKWIKELTLKPTQ